MQQKVYVRPCPSDSVSIPPKEGTLHPTCACDMAGGYLCYGPLCRTQVAPEGDWFVSSYPSNCYSCRCAHVTKGQQEIWRPQVWTSNQLYYHLHVSKTGGTTFEKLLRWVTRRKPDVTLCATEKHPFTHDPYFAEPQALIDSGCSVVTAEGKMEDVEGQFLGRKPHIIVILRHPVLRTISQFNHDLSVESYGLRVDKSTLFTLGKKSIVELFETVPPELIHNRFRDWQKYRMQTNSSVFPEVLSTYAFVGLTEFLQTSTCLFFFTFQLHSEFHGCLDRDIGIYNAACVNQNCSTGQFTDKKTDKSVDLHHMMLRKLEEVDDKTYEVVRNNTHQDHRIYNYGWNLFWQRVAVMEQVTGVRFNDLPPEYAGHRKPQPQVGL